MLHWWDLTMARILGKAVTVQTGTEWAPATAMLDGCLPLSPAVSTEPAWDLITGQKLGTEAMTPRSLARSRTRRPTV